MMRPLLLGMVLVTAPLAAQQSPAIGVWQVSFPAVMKVENGVATPVMGTGTLTVEASGDSLVPP